MKYRVDLVITLDIEANDQEAAEAKALAIARLKNKPPAQGEQEPAAEIPKCHSVCLVETRNLYRRAP